MCGRRRIWSFVHNSITKFVAPDLSYPQAQRWKQAKTKTPTHHLTVPVKSARRRHGRSGGATPRKRWNDAVGTALAYGPGGKNEPSSAHGRHPPVFDAERPQRGRAKAFRGGVTQKPSHDGRVFPWPCPPTVGGWRRIHAMAAAKVQPESNKGPSERLSAPGGKSTRVRCKSPSKTPKNGF